MQVPDNKPTAPANANRVRLLRPLEPERSALLNTSKYPLLAYLGDYRDYVDKIHIRSKKPFTNADMERLRKFSKKAWWEFDSPTSSDGKPYLKRPFVTTIVLPTDEALWFSPVLNNQLIKTELSREYIMPDPRIAARLVDFFDKHFVQRWHSGNQQHFEEHGTYTKFEKPVGVNFLHYDRKERGGSKFAFDADAFKIEAKVIGAASLKRLGIPSTRELSDFNHAAFWQRNLILRDVDYARFGRWYENHRLGQKRRVERESDFRIGAILYRLHAETREFAKFVKQFSGGNGKSRWVVDADDAVDAVDLDKRITRFTMQALVDRYGLNAPFILPVEVY